MTHPYQSPKSDAELAAFGLHHKDYNEEVYLIAREAVWARLRIESLEKRERQHLEQIATYIIPCELCENDTERFMPTWEDVDTCIEQTGRPPVMEPAHCYQCSPPTGEDMAEMSPQIRGQALLDQRRREERR